ncbi:type i restriction-modification system methyltransferase subunit [Halogeometricum borinquense DSM 11551]|uniref:type I restriction-modification system methyltransferase subunit n=1 Tax=Halogeometricum borinquense (strain ATCC 700274 / DSM 11551 / JCM 10706 / KCTC 4070 / PR3) TaxID=469382 RepID=E4NTJ7_HALBP|nr:N-6 DNA methylase [Halogeometricum borinquense]ADQ67049.1 type I restriction-modification system methyltransferase subunit [Halogeometricum borinquense DSM 11551]ELY29596.1 type i restriction-modification system methyltransferase subunit [Halogeometricum borinquense DSM 11551]
MNLASRTDDSFLDDDRLARYERILSRYCAALRDSIDAEPIAAVRGVWRTFVRDHHGSVFAGLADESDASLPDDADAVARDVFIQSLSFDYLLRTHLDAAECALGIELERSADASDLIAGFETVHTAVEPELDAATREEIPELATDFIQTATPAAVTALHHGTVSRLARRAFGRYDTPAGLAELAVESVRNGDFTERVVLDPGCGAGAFLAAAARAKLDSLGRDGETPANSTARIANSVRGFDVNPVAVRAARLALVLSLRPLLSRDDVSSFAPRVVLADAVETTADDAPLGGTRADVLLGNPPWLTWDSLTPRVKDRWRDGPMANPDLDLFAHRGRDARLGYANDDLSVPFAWTCVHKFLRDGGRAAFVLKRDLMTGPAGKLLRRRRVGSRPLSMRHIHDFGSLSPFGREVAAGTALYRLDVGANGGSPADDCPIPTTRWSRNGETPSFDSLATIRQTLTAEDAALVPADPDTEASPWVRADAERRALGSSGYRIRHGVKDDAKAVYALDEETIEEHDLEPDHIYPYLKSKHVVKYGLFGYDRHLVPQRLAGEENESAVRRETPNTYAYLDANRDRLEARGSSWFDDGPFYSLFGLGPYTWADYKVVWCRLGYKPHFTVVSTVEDPLLGEKPVVPGDHCMFVGTDDKQEAHYLCGLLNSAPYQRCLRDISSGGKSSLSKSTVSRLAMPEWDARDEQVALAEASMAAHRIVPEHVDCSKRAYNAKTVPEIDAAQARVDRAAERFLASRDDQ